MIRKKYLLGPLLIIVLILIQASVVLAQKEQAEYFESPLEIPLILAGNFGEIRSNHFHGGLDFKTNGKSGYNVLASQRGYISRIKVASGGYGRAIYIQHPSGHTSVYGHLMKFRKDIEEYVIAQQYKKERFGIDIFPDPGKFKLSQGEYFALSGNTGGSQAPHLHFEIRDSQTQNPINPLQYKLDVNDKTPPLIKSVYLYSLNGRKDLKNPIKVRMAGSSGKFYPTKNQVYGIDKTAGIGIETIDYLDDANNPCGVNIIEVYLDNELISEIQINEFSFSESKYINSFIDYELYRRRRYQVLKTFIDPNNHLSIYEFVKNKGKITIKDKAEHQLKIIVKDIHGNASTTKLRVKLDPDVYSDQDFSRAFYSAYFSYAETNRFEAEGINIYLSPNTLYDDLYFKYESDSIPPKGFSKIHRVHNQYVPLHRAMTIKIKPDNLPENLKSKAIISRISSNGNLSAIGGSWENDMIKVSTGSFGSFIVAIDTTAPRIVCKNLSETDIAVVGKSISFKISDNFSGISSFRGTLDGKWILFEYDGKTGTLIHHTDPYLFPFGKELKLILRVRDRVGNLAEYKKTVVRK